MEPWTRQLLSRCGLFDGSDPSELDAIECIPQRIDGGQTLFREGEAGDCLYVVVSGRLRVGIQRSQGEEVLGEVGPGEVVGEMALLADEPRSAAVHAIRDTALLRISRDSFERLLQRSPALAMRVARSVILRLRRGGRPDVPRTSIVRSIAVVPAGSQAPAGLFAQRLTAALARMGPSLHLRPGVCEEALGPGAAQTPAGGEKEPALLEWLDAREREHRFLVYEADLALTHWTRRCLRQVDRILLVGRSEDTPQLGEVEEALIKGEEVRTLARRQLVLLHQERRPRGTHKWLNYRQVRDANAPVGMAAIGTRNLLQSVPRPYLHHHLMLDSQDDFDRLARSFAGRTVSLVLGGGGARGCAHIGVLKALREAGVVVDLFGGASIGAIIAAEAAAGWDPETMHRRTREEYGGFRAVKHLTLPMVSLLSVRAMRASLERSFGEQTIEDLWINYFCVSSNLSRSEVTVHREGLLVKWLQASAAVPGVFPPVLEGGDVLTDGGVLNNLPVDVMRHISDGPMVSVDVGSTANVASSPHLSGPAPSPWRMIANRLNPFSERWKVPSIFDLLLTSACSASERSVEKAKGIADLDLRPPIERFGMFDFHRIDEIVETGYRYAKEALLNWKTT